MKSFYRNLLERTSLEKSAAIEASRSGFKKRAGSDLDRTEDSISKEPETDKELAEQARASGKMVVLNDDEQIVDKRQLLSAGLNIVKKEQPTSKNDDSSRNDYNDIKYGDKHSSRNREEMRRKDKYSRELETQIIETRKKKDEEERQKKEELLKKLARKNDDKAISDAKARYLARKNKSG